MNAPLCDIQLRHATFEHSAFSRIVGSFATMLSLFLFTSFSLFLLYCRLHWNSFGLMAQTNAMRTFVYVNRYIQVQHTQLPGELSFRQNAKSCQKIKILFHRSCYLLFFHHAAIRQTCNIFQIKKDSRTVYSYFNRK